MNVSKALTILLLQVITAQTNVCTDQKDLLETSKTLTIRFTLWHVWMVSLWDASIAQQVSNSTKDGILVYTRVDSRLKQSSRVVMKMMIMFELFQMTQIKNYLSL